MKHISHITILTINAVLLTFLCAAAYHSSKKPGLSENDALHFPLRINSVILKDEDQAEFFLSRYAVGDSIQLTIEDSAGVLITRVTSVDNYYSTPFTFFKIFLVIAMFSLGVVVYFFGPPGMVSTLFNLASCTLSAAIMGTRTMYAVEPSWLGNLLCSMFFISYGMLAVFFVHFTLYFPRARSFSLLRWMPLVYLSAFGLSLWNCLTYLRDSHQRGYPFYDASILPGSFLNAFVVLMLLLGVGNFIHLYYSSTEPSEKKRLRWILFGLSVGPTPFILLSALPQAFGLKPIIPESFMLLMLLALPLTFVISIVKHKVLDIDLIINRSIVYGIILSIFLGVFILLLGTFTIIVGSYAEVSSPFLLAIIAASISLLFQPLRKRIQGYVDKRFFNVQYNFRETQRKLFDEIKHSYDAKGLAALVIREIQHILPVERIGFFTINQSTHRLALIAHEHFDILEKRGISLHVDELKSSLQRPVALDSEIEPGLDIESADAEVFRRWNMALVLACSSEDGIFLGFLVFGRKKSGFRFLGEDIDLLSGIAGQVGLALQRVTMQEQLILEHAESERLEKLNQLKSYFVSSVSHDLKTPLTSIKIFAELLRTKENLTKKDRNEYLEIIEGESDRLRRMINNVLDFSRVERGIKEYHPVSVELHDEVEEILRSMKYQLKIEKFILEVRYSKKPSVIRVDKDSFAEALMNLISNAMKYSLHTKHIAVSTFIRDQYAGVRVQDHGVGIPSDQLPHIFDQFYRVDDQQLRSVGGTGLGLTIVKHMMDAHGAKIEVESTVGKGSSFTLLFPMEESNETNSGN